MKKNKKKELSFYSKLQKAIIIIAKILIDVNRENRKKRKIFLKQFFKNIRKFFKFINECLEIFLDYWLEKICPEDYHKTVIIDISEYMLEQQKINERRRIYR